MTNPPEPRPDVRTRNRRTLLAIVAACAAPTLIAWALVSDRLGWRPERLDVHGELLSPPPALPAAAAAAARTAAAGERAAWTLVYLSPTGCDEPCALALERLRNAHLGTGKGALFLRRLYVSPAGAGAPPPPAAATASPPLAVMEVPAPGWADYQGLLPGGGPAVLLADPAGWVVLRYPGTFPMEGLVRDAKRLLKAAGAL